jgi:hypothetical protein
MKQECSLSPVLFNVHVDVVVVEYKNRIPAIGVYAEKYSRMKIILFADDGVLTATSELDLKAAIHRFYIIMN